MGGGGGGGLGESLGWVAGDGSLGVGRRGGSMGWFAGGGSLGLVAGMGRLDCPSPLPKLISQRGLSRSVLKFVPSMYFFCFLWFYD